MRRRHIFLKRTDGNETKICNYHCTCFEYNGSTCTKHCTGKKNFKNARTKVLLKSRTTTGVKFSWKQISGAQGSQIKMFLSDKSVTKITTTGNMLTVKLGKTKTATIKVRGYKFVKKKKVYTRWSKQVKVKVYHGASVKTAVKPDYSQVCKGLWVSKTKSTYNRNYGMYFVPKEGVLLIGKVSKKQDGTYFIKGNPYLFTFSADGISVRAGYGFGMAIVDDEIKEGIPQLIYNGKSIICDGGKCDGMVFSYVCNQCNYEIDN